VEVSHHGKGDHDVWHDPKSGQKVTVPWKIMSRHTANDILKDAGLAKAWRDARAH
jgi:predicted RNA binding protein YcfA (HicA-like mRNA interferase family)